MNKIKIKICGQNNPAIIEHCLNIGVNQQGLIFYDKSPRYLDNDTLKIINKYFNNFRECFVGVFVNPTFEQIEQKLSIYNFQTIQLHGNEDQEFIDQIKLQFQKRIYKSISPKDFMITKLNNIDQFLIEGHSNSNEQPGGNNKTWNWSEFENPFNHPFILSGGLNEQNLPEAINLTGANFVDINSGVEEAKGEKSLSLIDSLISSLKS
tara:strand:- start:221 stop:844 length:624 start_codon:yes stop_codon:yes gene_type:complete